jgi:hypothetical protein
VNCFIESCSFSTQILNVLSRKSTKFNVNSAPEVGRSGRGALLVCLLVALDVECQWHDFQLGHEGLLIDGVSNHEVVQILESIE